MTETAVHEMFQCFVTCKGRQVPIGPKFSTKEPVEQFAAMMRQSIMQGRLNGWNDPQVVTLVAVKE